MLGALEAEQMAESIDMTVKSNPNEDVQAVLDDLDEWTYGGTELLHYNGNRMHVKINLERMGKMGIADLVEWLIRRNWCLKSLDLSGETAEMTGQAYEVE